MAANAENLPLADASQDIVTVIFLFHELPAPVRRRVAHEMARVLKPGGLLVFLDSAQYGDVPGWDGALESFPHRFHEPYYRNYLEDDLDGIFTAAGLLRAGDALRAAVEADGAAQGDAVDGAATSIGFAGRPRPILGVRMPSPRPSVRAA